MTGLWHRRPLVRARMLLVCPGVLGVIAALSHPLASEAQAAPQAPSASEQPGGPIAADTTQPAPRAEADRRCAPSPVQARGRDAPPHQQTKQGARQPSVDEVVAAALAAHADGLADTDTLAQRARLRGLVPSLSLSARRGQTVDLSQSQSVGTDRLRLDTDNDLTLQASLSFDLPRLVFAREETALLRERRAQQQAARRLAEEVIALYFARCRVLAELASALPAEERAQKQLDLAMLEARLQLLTGGRFRQRLPHASKGRAKPPRGTP